jgi:hypothetical protein
MLKKLFFTIHTDPVPCEVCAESKESFAHQACLIANIESVFERYHLLNLSSCGNLITGCRCVAAM